jgi:hypothetical protein
MKGLGAFAGRRQVGYTLARPAKLSFWTHGGNQAAAGSEQALQPLRLDLIQ